MLANTCSSLLVLRPPIPATECESLATIFSVMQIVAYRVSGGALGLSVKGRTVECPGVGASGMEMVLEVFAKRTAFTQ